MTRPKDPTKPKTLLQQKKDFRKRFDEYCNEYTGIGSRTADSLQFTQFLRSRRLSYDDLSNLYHDNDIFSRLAELVPSEALKQGFHIETNKESENSELAKYGEEAKQDPAVSNTIREIFMKLDELQLTQKAQRAWVWGNVFGAGILYIGINDGNAQDKPVDMARIQSVDFLKVLDRRYVRPFQVYANPDHPKFGEISHFAVRPPVTAAVGTAAPSVAEAIIHESRIVFFEGVPTAPDRKQQNGGWADSVFQRLEEPIKHLVTSFQSVASMMQRSAQGKMRMSGFLDAISANTPDYIENRLTDMMLRASNNKPFVFDANENEDFQLESYSFNGIPQLQELFMLRVCSALRIPYSILFGQSPSGMNATGDMELRSFYDQIKHKQVYELKPILEYIVKLVMLSKKGPTKGKELPQWSVAFPSLWQLNETEKAQLCKLNAETGKLLAETDRLNQPGQVPPTVSPAKVDLVVPAGDAPKVEPPVEPNK